MQDVRVLVADDEVDICLSLKLHLEREGYQVTTVPDGQAALAELQRGDFDFLLTDLVMPHLDGLGLLDAMADRGLKAGVILMSAHADVDTAMQAIQKGALDYVAKPFNTKEVLFRLRKAAEQSRLRAEVGRLKRVISEEMSFAGIVANSEPMHSVFNTIRKVANYKTTVLLNGESGTGKELVAKALHYNSNRRDAAFVAVNCGAIPANLLESELFGHVKGAFTDAIRSRVGLFQEAEGGTLFLDEIGEFPLPLQVKLLRVLQEEEVRRVGDSRSRNIDVRIVAATVRDLQEEVKGRRFREDLFYRLNVLPIRLPPLRERPGDVELLVEHFIRQYNKRLGTSVKGLNPSAMKLLSHYAWPGNVRELENTIERALVLTDLDLIRDEDLPTKIRESQDKVRMILATGELSIKKTARMIEEELIRRALTKTKGNRTRAAEHLEISHRALLYKIKDYEVDL